MLYVVRKDLGGRHAYLGLQGPFEYAQWFEDHRDATKLPAWKAYQYADILSAEAVRLV